MRKICNLLDNILGYFTDYSLIIDWYLPHFGEKTLAKADGVYGFLIEGWFYPFNKNPYFCKFFPSNLEKIEKNKKLQKSS